MSRQYCVTKWLAIGMHISFSMIGREHRLSHLHLGHLADAFVQAEPTLKLRGLTLLVPTTSTWELWICWSHLQPNISPPSNPVAGTCTSSGTPSSSLKMSSKDTMNRRQFQAQLASSLILVSTALPTPKRGQPY